LRRYLDRYYAANVRLLYQRNRGHVKANCYRRSFSSIVQAMGNLGGFSLSGARFGKCKLSPVGLDQF